LTTPSKVKPDDIEKFCERHIDDVACKVRPGSHI
jgi:hypothetical protein